MTDKAAFDVCMKRLRQQAIANVERDIAQSQLRLQELVSGKGYVSQPLKLEDEGGGWRVAGGAYIGDCQEMAREVARLTGRAVSFRHNDRLYTEKPPERA